MVAITSTRDQAQAPGRTAGVRTPCEPSPRPSAPLVSTRDQPESPLVRRSRVELASDSPTRPRIRDSRDACPASVRPGSRYGPAHPSPARLRAPGPVHRPRTRRHGVHSDGGCGTRRQQRVASSTTFAEVVSGLPAQASRSAESGRAVAGRLRGDSRRCSQRGCTVYSRPGGWGGRRPGGGRVDPPAGGDEV